MDDMEMKALDGRKGKCIKVIVDIDNGTAEIEKPEGEMVAETESDEMAEDKAAVKAAAMGGSSAEEIEEEFKGGKPARTLSEKVRLSASKKA